MASWLYLPALLMWAWVAGGIHATSPCGNCEEDGDSVVCPHSTDEEKYQVKMLPGGEVLHLRCESTTRTLNFSSIEDCSFPLVERIEIYGCPLPNVSFGEVVLQLGVYLENVTSLGFFDRNEGDRELESWHLDGLVSLVKLQLVNNAFGGIPEDLFAPTPNLQSLRITADSFSTLPEALFINTPNLEAVDFEGSRLENLPEYLFANLTALENVTLTRNYIAEIHPETFADNVNLRNLDFRHNHISSFQREVFQKLKSLKSLHLKGNLLSSLPDGAFFGLISLEELDLSFNVLERLPEKIFDKLVKVKTIDLSNNSLGELPGEVFMRCSSLQNLSLEHNSLQKLKTTMFPWPDTALTYLNLGHNNISFPVRSSKILQHSFVTYEDNFPLSGQTKLKEVLLNDNRVESIPNAFNRLFVNLVKIDLSGNKILYIAYTNLHFLHESVEIDLRDNGMRLIDFHDMYQLPNDKEVKMFLGGNNLACDCRLYKFTRLVQGKSGNMRYDKMKIIVKDIDQVTCHDSGNKSQALQEVDTRLLVCAMLRKLDCTMNCSCFWRPHDEMYIIDCSFQGLLELPNLISYGNKSISMNMQNNSLTSLKRLQDPQYTHVVNLTVSNNRISFINQSHIPETLKELDVRGNNLTTLPEPLLNFLNATDVTLSFGRNPWICDCDLISFLNFLHVPSRKVTDFEDIRCVEGSDSLLDLTEYDLCPFFLQPMVIVTLVAIGAFLLLFAVLGTVSFYKYKQGIKVWLYAHRMCLWAITEDEMDVDKKFDAFISFSHKDEEFVNTVLVPGLESGDPKYRICLHYRDWVPGEYIQNQILKSVEASRRTIVVLSSNFIESVWGQLEFKAAHSQALQDKTNRIIVIVYGEIPPESELDEKLKLYIATKSYVKWGDSKFWEKLRYIMPHPPKKLN